MLSKPLRSDSDTTLDWALEFREAAYQGNVEWMKSIYRDHKPDVNQPGKESGRTAAHRAAEKGHAAALRLLYNLGADLFSEDNQGFRPQQLSDSSECLSVFQLTLCGIKTLKAVNKYFPDKVFVQDRSEPQFKIWRETKKSAYEERAKNELEHLIMNTLSNESPQQVDLKVMETCIHSVNYLCSSYVNLNLAIQNNQTKGACEENSLTAYGYLSAVDKPSFSIDAIVYDVGDDNHAITVLNLDRDKWDQAFVIDPLYNKCFFYFSYSCADLPYDAKLLETGISQCTAPLWFPYPNFPKTRLELQTLTEKLTQQIATLFNASL